MDYKEVRRDRIIKFVLLGHVDNNDDYVCVKTLENRLLEYLWRQKIIKMNVNDSFSIP